MAQNLATIEKLYTDDEYLKLERQALDKHELIDGKIVAMAGATREHILICGNVLAGIHTQIRGRDCETYANDMRVRMKKGRYGYPDVVVVCGEPKFADDEFDVLLNPIVVVEVLSTSTRFRDKTEKLETYQKMESIREVLLVEQDYVRIEHYIKQTPMQWLVKIYEERHATVVLDSVGCSLPIDEVYYRIDFAPPADV